MERRVWKTEKAGSLSSLRAVTEAAPTPQGNQALIQVRSVGMNFADIFALLGLYSATPQGAFIPGLEFSGVVLSVGPLCTRVKAKDRVMGVIRFGGYASHVCADERYLTPLPDGWSFPQGAAFLAQGLTAYYAICELGAFKSGQTALVQSAAGGVGLFCLQMIHALGGRSVAVVGNPIKAEFLRQLNPAPDQIIVRNKATFRTELAASLSALNVRGLDLVLDSVMGPFFDPSYAAMNAGGRLVLFGAADMMPSGRRPNPIRLALQYLRRPKVDPLKMISDNKSVMGFNLIWLWDRVEEFPHMLADLMGLCKQPPHVGREYAFDDAPKALAYFQSGASTGKVVLTLEG